MDSIRDPSDIGEESYSWIKWLAAVWPELGPWLLIGVSAGGGTVLTVIGAVAAAGEPISRSSGIIMASLGGLAVAISLCGVYLARPGRQEREDRKKRKARGERHDEMMEEFEKERASLRAERDEALAQRAKIAQFAAEDREWSADPFRFFDVAPCKCDINLSLRLVSLRLSVNNRYAKARRLWVSANVAVFQDGASSPLFTIPLPVVPVDAAPGITEASPLWGATMDPSQAEEARAVYESDHVLRVQLVNMTLTTLANLSSDPVAVNSDRILPVSTAIVEHVVYE